MRGKRHQYLFYCLHYRITPADAGKTLRSLSMQSTFIGSPPRMRGKQRPLPSRRNTFRITPADAGKTLLRRHYTHHTRDHPRGCGENFLLWQTQFPFAGSPPRMRGKRRYVFYLTVTTRITPADAGKTLSPCICVRLGVHHPRGCGENLGDRVNAVVAVGSPPRMRGKHSKIQLFNNINRITPADAGKTRPARLSPWAAQDHPRGCGENWGFGGFGVRQMGSPPRMRGKLAEGDSLGNDERITPAGAGKTQWSSRGSVHI